MTPTTQEIQGAVSALTPHITPRKSATWRRWPLWLGGRLRWLRFSAAGIWRAETELFQNFNEVLLSFNDIPPGKEKAALYLWLGLIAEEPELTIADVILKCNEVEERGWTWLWRAQIEHLYRVYTWLLTPFLGLPKTKRAN